MLQHLTTMSLIDKINKIIFLILDTAKYKKPIFKFKNIQSGKFLTAEAQKLVQKSDSGSSDQQW